MMLSEDRNSRQGRLPDFALKELIRADELGLVARWSREFGYISIHDPTTGDWHDLLMKDAPAWAKKEARKRKELWRFHGVTEILSAKEMEDIWLEEKTAPTDDTPALALGGTSTKIIFPSKGVNNCQNRQDRQRGTIRL
jgi:hypothetical protein